jgi:hypothetical protein
MAFHPEGVGRDRTAEDHRREKLARVEDGTTHAALVLDGEDAVGWCEFGPPTELPRIKRRAQYDKTAVSVPDWRITRFFVARSHRGRGAAQRDRRAVRTPRAHPRPTARQAPLGGAP